MLLDRHGWLVCRDGVVHVPSPNADERPAETVVSLLVVHNISLPAGCFGGPAVLQLFTNQLDLRGHPSFASLAGLRVSAHFLIRRTGEVVQCVSTQHRAWHAGLSYYRERESCNSFSIGVELEGTDYIPYTQAQYTQLARLTGALRSRYPLRAAVGHEHIAPGRKSDPGPAFDWSLYGRLAGWSRRQLGRAAL